MYLCFGNIARTRRSVTIHVRVGLSLPFTLCKCQCYTTRTHTAAKWPSSFHAAASLLVTVKNDCLITARRLSSYFRLITSLRRPSILGSQHDAGHPPAIDSRKAPVPHIGCRSISAARAAANQLHVAAAVDRRERQTDGRTPDRYIDAYRMLCGQRQQSNL